MKVHWTDLAVKYLADIHEYIARTSPTYALRMVDRLTRRVAADRKLSGLGPSRSRKE